MDVLLTYKSKIDLINRYREKVEKLIFRHSRASHFISSSGLWPKLELINVLITCKHKKYRIIYFTHIPLDGVFATLMAITEFR